MTFKMEIVLGDDAMTTGHDVGMVLIRITKRLSNVVDLADFQYTVMDDNGNRVGNCWVE